jgi:hypothetical protein
VAALCGHYVILDILQISINEWRIFEDVPQKFRYKPIINSASVAPTLQAVTAATMIENSFSNVSQYLYEIL